jgi:ribosomal protein S18 acetylase RimI-like enzyme
MVALNLQVRPANFADHYQISNLIFFESHVHRHLDWRAPLDWLGSSDYWVLEDGGKILAALACPPDPPEVAWLRLFTHTSKLSALEAWSPLWNVARAGIESQGNITVAVIALHNWLQDILVESKFELRQNIVLLEWVENFIDLPPLPSNIAIRSLRAYDLPQVVETDASAFAPLWHNSHDALYKALSQALFATVAEKDGEMVGYQLSTLNPYGAHLARLAVRKEAQGQGIGKYLLGDLIHRTRQRGLSRLSVNTQGDNAVSLALYQKIGFSLTGEQYPVYVYQT